MLFTDAMFVGISPNAGKRPLQYAVMDSKLRIQALDVGDIESVLALLVGLESPVVGIGGPQGPNQGLMSEPGVRRRFNLRPEGDTWGNWRLCEYELRRRNIRLHNTPKEDREAARWMQLSFTLFRRLEKLGFEMGNANEPLKPGTSLEVQPHASYSVLLERRPFLKKTLEGRLQRQLVLFLERLNVENPIETLEQITRHHLLNGYLPLEGLHTAEELDVLVTAYTCYLAAVKPERVSYVGRSPEGFIVVPTPELKDFYV
jgi:hypothetical protein